MRSARVTITGRVQGVGYRAWVAAQARDRHLSGWVRNRRDGSVEALLSGDDAAVDAMLVACWTGPTLARVTSVAAQDHPPPAGNGFDMLPTA